MFYEGVTQPGTWCSGFCTSGSPEVLTRSGEHAQRCHGESCASWLKRSVNSIQGGGGGGRCRRRIRANLQGRRRNQAREKGPSGPPRAVCGYSRHPALPSFSRGPSRGIVPSCTEAAAALDRTARRGRRLTSSHGLLLASSSPRLCRRREPSAHRARGSAGRKGSRCHASMQGRLPRLWQARPCWAARGVAPALVQPVFLTAEPFLHASFFW